MGESLRYRLYDSVEDQWLPGVYTRAEIKEKFFKNTKETNVNQASKASRDGYMLGGRYKPWPEDYECEKEWDRVRLIVLGNLAERNSDQIEKDKSNLYKIPDESRIKMKAREYMEFSLNWDKYRFRILNGRKRAAR